ncbi:MAG: hypothetical protein U0232_10890 [Thermomicrobiales bacterium]
MHLKRLSLTIGGLALIVGLLAACGSSPTATLAPVASASARASSAPSAAASAGASASTSAASPTVARSASPSAGSSTTGSPTTTSASPTRAASPSTSGTPGTPGAGTPTTGFVPSQGYIRLGGQASHRQKWAFTGFTIGGLSGDLKPTYDVVGANRKVVLPDVAGVSLEAYQVGGVISVPNPVGGGFVTADASNPLTVPAQALFTLPDMLVFSLAPVNASYTQQGTQQVNGKTTIAYRTQVTIADLSFVSPTLQGQAGTATTTVYLDSTTGILIAMESTVKSNTSATTATARLDVTDINAVPAIAVPK